MIKMSALASPVFPEIGSRMRFLPVRLSNMPAFAMAAIENRTIKNFIFMI